VTSSWWVIRTVLLGRPLSLIGTVVMALLLSAAILGPTLVPERLAEFNPRERLKPPGREHLLGTDTAGRDILVRIILGSRLSVMAATIIIGLSVATGASIGLVSGFLGGWFDELMMRVADVFLSVPSLILSIAVATILGPSLFTAMIGLAVGWWPVYGRLMRAEVLAISRRLYVEAASALGLSRPRVLTRHVLPNGTGPILVQASLDFGSAILYTSALSFIGLGAQPPSPEWGAMISAGRDHLREAWWFATFPGLAIFVSVMACNLLGDAVRDVLDPRTRLA
jgi:peptide/nickel transport system permease protein